MKTTKSTVALMMALSGATMLCACSSSDDPSAGTIDPGPRHLIDVTPSQKTSISKGNELAYDMWNKVCSAAEDNGGNQFFSPLSLQMAISMVANGESEHLSNEIAELYAKGDAGQGVANLNLLNRVLLYELPKVDKSVTIGIANSMWCDLTLDFTDSFQSLCADNYDATSHKYEVKTAKAREEINAWCSGKTNGLIPEFLENVPEETLMFINASYFKGQWKYKFNKKNTVREEFHCESGESMPVDMMAHEDYCLDGIDSDMMTYVEVPYGNEGFVMKVMMPKESVDFNECVALLKDKKYARDNKAIPCVVRLEMPKFELSASYYSLKAVMQAMGVPHIEEEVKNIVEDDNFSVNTIIQKTKCIVDEDGTEAAAVTKIGMVGGSSSIERQKLDVTLDRPFFFTIEEQSTGAILFMGKVAEFGQ